MVRDSFLNFLVKFEFLGVLSGKSCGNLQCGEGKVARVAVAHFVHTVTTSKDGEESDFRPLFFGSAPRYGTDCHSRPPVAFIYEGDDP